MKVVFILIIYLLTETCTGQITYRPTRLMPVILEKLELICGILKAPKEGEAELLIQSIRLLNKTMKKLGGWIEHPKNPERPQERFINDGILAVKKSAKFTHMEYDEKALSTVFSWTDKQAELLIALREDTEQLRIAIYKICKSSTKKKTH